MARDISIISLILGNIVPLFGVLFLDWSPFLVVFSYWSENIVIGFYNVLKMRQASLPMPSDSPPIMVNIPWWKGPRYTRSKRAFILSFIAIYGIFTLVHGGIIWSIFDSQTLSVVSVLAVMFPLFVGHGISYLRNFIGKGEYLKVTPAFFMLQPFQRVILMHVTVLVGGFVAEVFSSALPMLVVLVFLKIFVDLLTHRHLHSLIANLPSHFSMPVKPTHLSEEESKIVNKLMNTAYQKFLQAIKEKFG